MGAGARSVDDITAYKTVEAEPANLPGLGEILADKKFDLVTFTSSSTVRNFDALVRRAVPQSIGDIPCAAIGPITARTARELGYRVEITAEIHTIDGLVGAICSHYAAGAPRGR